MQRPVHLNALRALEASARHQSFAAAAAELNVTPAAVGQLVRGLEDWLGAALFHRQASGRQRLVPTDCALQALPDIRAGFDQLARGLDRLREGTARQGLTVTVSPAFAAKWLLPRMDRFHAAHPDIDLRLDTSLGLQDFATQGIDIGVRYGAGHWPGLQAKRLLGEAVFPVCSPALHARLGALAGPAQLAAQTLIHDLSVDQQAGFPGWDSWFAHAGIARGPARRGLRINNSAAVLQAAIDGQGIALARSVMAREDLAAGRLLRLFPQIEMASPLAYFVVQREGVDAPRPVTAFRDWLRHEAAAADGGQRSP